MSKPKFAIVFSIIFFGVLFFAKASLAATYYVDQNHPSARDSNPGTESLPWLTITKATQTLIAGDTVLVKAGRYMDPNPEWYSAFSPSNSGTAANPITFKSYVKGAAILVWNPAVPDAPAMRVLSRNYIIIDGFKVEGSIGFHDSGYGIIRNCEVTVGRPDEDLNWGVFLHTSHHCLVENNYVHDMTYVNSGNNAAPLMLFRSSDSIIQNNDVNALCSDGVHKLYSAYGQKGGDLYRNIWRYNIARNAGDAGFLGMGSTAGDLYSTDNTYYQNIVINSPHAFNFNHLCYRFKIYNNVFYNSERVLSAWLSSGDTEMWNNIAVISGIGISTVETPPETLISFSDFNNFYGYSAFAEYHYSPFASTLTVWKQLTAFDDNSISANSLFINAGGGNFHLNTGSPCLNAGIDRQDFDGDGNTTERINMGAYITGNETIGYTPSGSLPSDTTPPTAPTGLAVR